MNPTFANSVQPNRGSASDFAELRMMLMQSQYNQRQEPAKRTNSLMFWRREQLEDPDPIKDRRLNTTISLLRGGFNNQVASKSILSSVDLSASPMVMTTMGPNPRTNNALACMRISSPSSTAVTSNRLKNNSFGGFPMPRLMKAPQPLQKSLMDLAMIMGKKGKMEQQKQTPQKKMSKDSFPLPKLRPAAKKTNSSKPYSLQSYRRIWFASHDKYANREIFSRRVHRGLGEQVIRKS
jgi:hypothetical protein